MDFYYDEEWASSLHSDILKLDLGTTTMVDDWEEFAKLAMIMKFNSFGFTGPEDSSDGRCVTSNVHHALFEISCRLSHSCRPNCNWSTTHLMDGDDGSMVLRLIRPVKAGEELTIDYFGMALLPTKERRAKLEKSKRFACQCERCSKPDAMRRFSCTVDPGACPGVHYCSSDGASWTNCSACGRPAVNPEALFRREAALSEEVNRITTLLNRTGMTNTLDSRIRELQPPHKYHHLAMPIFQLKSTLHYLDNNVSMAIACAQAQLECMEVTLNHDPHCESARLAVDLAGELEQAGQLEQAEIMYQKGVRNYMVFEGPGDAKYAKAIEHLLRFQKRRVNNNAAAGNSAGSNNSTGRCALCGAPATRKCSRCQQVAYCCKAHQRLHWPGIHKKLCSKAMS